MNAADILDVVFGMSRKPFLAKIGAKTKDDARKRYGIDFSVYKRSDNKVQQHIVTSVNEQLLQLVHNVLRHG